MPQLPKIILPLFEYLVYLGELDPEEYPSKIQVGNLNLNRSQCESQQAPLSLTSTCRLADTNKASYIGGGDGTPDGTVICMSSEIARSEYGQV